MMVADEKKALEYVHDYFTMDFKAFIKHYFDSKEMVEINRNVSRKKFDEIFGSLTNVQSSIINDRDSRFIVVPAGPGSGKTYVLVRKLASLVRTAPDADLLAGCGYGIQQATYRPYRRRCQIRGNQDFPFLLL